MSIPRKGSTVTVHYIGTLENGRIFDSTDETPLVFTIGNNEVFPKLEEALLTMRVGEVRNIVIASSDAFGPRLADNIIQVPRARFPEGIEMKTGQKLSIEFGGGKERIMIVTAISDVAVTLDGNHPLAGQDLTFALRLVHIE